MKIKLSDKSHLSSAFLVGGLLFRTIFIDSEDGTRAADIELIHCVRSDLDRYFNVTLYKDGAIAVRDIQINSWQKAKKLALLWVEG